MNFIEKLTIVSSKHRHDTKNKFNIFSVLHKNHDERRLHSRFISNLLSPNSNHGQGNLFLDSFLELIDIYNFELNDVIVTPNELEKSEWNDIDICIMNKKQAIIIENKIYANDSNHENENGEVIPQLIGYFEKVKRHLGLCDDDAKQNIHLVYLTLNKKEPSHIDCFLKVGTEPILIDYIQFIPSWLTSCQKKINNSFLNDSIKQYKQLLLNLTNDFNLAMELKYLVSDNIEHSWNVLLNNSPKSENLESVNCLINNLKHVKWHTVHEFWNELGLILQEKLKVKVNVPSDELVTKTTHRDLKKGLALNFTYKEMFIYIANDSKGFTWGIQHEWDWFSFKNAEKIIFSDFGNEETFKMINLDYSHKIINEIVCEIIRILNGRT